MRIDTNIKPPATTEAAGPTAARKESKDHDRVDLTATDNLNRALGETPDIRAEKISRAKALIKDPGYPSEVVLAQVANVLAGNIGRQA